jgi:hypothetical protein
MGFSNKNSGAAAGIESAITTDWYDHQGHHLFENGTAVLVSGVRRRWQ